MIKLKENWDGVALMALAGLALALIGFAFIVVFSWSEIPQLQFPANTKMELFGQVGDFMGGLLNPILSFIAFVAVVISFRAQARNAKASEKAALELSVNQASQLEQLVKQGMIAEKQAFESVYFGLAQIHSRNVESASVTINGSVFRGRGCFEVIAKEFVLDRPLPPMMPAKGIAYINKYMASLDDFSSSCLKELGHYFRTVEQVIIYIDGAEALGLTQKQTYFDMFVASLSEFEIQCMFMYLVRDRRQPSLRLFVRYGFLKHYPDQVLLTQMRTVGFFIVDGEQVA